MSNEIAVANMVAQNGLKKSNSQPPIRYGAVRTCLSIVAQEALTTNASVHMPRIGCGLAGGKWEEIEPIIDAELINHGVNVYVYDY